MLLCADMLLHSLTSVIRDYHIILEQIDASLPPRSEDRIISGHRGHTLVQ